MKYPLPSPAVLRHSRVGERKTVVVLKRLKTSIDVKKTFLFNFPQEKCWSWRKMFILFCVALQNSMVEK